MSTAARQTLQPCPECGAEIRADGRFTVWCAACDWNVDPGRPEDDGGRLERLRRALARRHGEALFAATGDGRGRRPGRDAAGVVAYVIAGAIHAVTLGLAVAGLWFLLTGWGGFAMLLGLLLLGVAWPLRPRLGRLPEDGIILRRSDAPELYALVDEVARAAGTRSVDAIAVDGQPDASVTGHGLRGRLLTLGLPLWEVLTPQQRIALLGHELGHCANGDTRRGLVVATAYRSLATWHYFLTPIRDPSAAEMVVNLLYLVPRALVQGLLMVFEVLTARATQRGEYLADSLAARVGSTEAAVGVMDLLLVMDSVTVTLHREVGRRRMARRGDPANLGEGLWEELAAHMGSVPESEYERQRRAGALRGHSVGSTHPPTHLRRRWLLDAPALSASVVADTDRAERVAAELAGARQRVARQLVRDGLGGA
ncbi:M48 family metallopeptidase [Streptomyces sp. NPDC096152]|uniref:M48 family metallopeptidase n=1 Tax=Streptomyces sp. NPDC096152 TaxID=3366078 RepID=UPI00380671D6